LDPRWKGDLLGIPLVPSRRSMGSISAGNIRHGFRMVDGYTEGVDIASLSTDAFDFTACNIQFESWTTNSFRGPREWEPFVDDMLEDLKRLPVSNPPFWVDVPLHLTPPPDTFAIIEDCKTCLAKKRACSRTWPCVQCTSQGTKCNPGVVDYPKLYKTTKPRDRTKDKAQEDQGAKGAKEVQEVQKVQAAKRAKRAKQVFVWRAERPVRRFSRRSIWSSTIQEPTQYGRHVLLVERWADHGSGAMPPRDVRRSCKPPNHRIYWPRGEYLGS